MLKKYGKTLFKKTPSFNKGKIVFLNGDKIALNKTQVKELEKLTGRDIVESLSFSSHILNSKNTLGGVR